jgi:hypothetical protein
MLPANVKIKTIMLLMVFIKKQPLKPLAVKAAFYSFIFSAFESE